MQFPVHCAPVNARLPAPLHSCMSVHNRAPVAVGIVLVWSFGYWFFPVIGARHWFKGPPVAMEVAAAEQQAYNGHETSSKNELKD